MLTLASSRFNPYLAGSNMVDWLLPFVNLIQARVSWEEEIASIRLDNGISVGHFLD